jgi:AcrR family transcriptional regulator
MLSSNDDATVGLKGVPVPGREGTQSSARERLLAAADQLFYTEGVQSVGVERVLNQAGVARASLYSTFGSKDELIRAYLEHRHADSVEQVNRTLRRFRTPAGRLLGIFDALGEQFSAPGFDGCAFDKASAEAPRGGAVNQATEAYREWVRTLFTTLATEAGVADPDALARQLHLLYDGAAQSARMDCDPSAATTARAAAALLYEAAAKN